MVHRKNIFYEWLHSYSDTNHTILDMTSAHKEHEVTQSTVHVLVAH